MKIIRWLLSHSFLILLIVVVIYGYMFWGNLLGKDTPAGKAVAYLSDEFVAVGDFVNAVKAKQARLNGEQSARSSEQPSGQPSEPSPKHSSEQQTAALSSTPDNAGETDKKSQLAQPVTAGVIERKETGDQVAQQTTQKVAEQVGKQPGEQLQNNNFEQAHVKMHATEVTGSKAVSGQANKLALVDDQSNSSLEESQLANAAAADEKTAAQSSADQSHDGQSGVKQTFVSPEIEKRLDNVDRQGRVIDDSQTGGAIKTNWITARKSFYQRNYTLSEQSYQKVIDNTEDNFDAYGELGNVYFNQGKNQQAASAYFEAAAILVRKGQVSRARSLMGLLRHLDKSKASELQQLIDSVNS